MSHYSAVVVLPPDTTIDNAHERIHAAMVPYCENDGDNEQGWWDFWQFGGRFTGRWDGYDPDSDPSLLEVCFLCVGTGIRDDKLGREIRRNNPAYTCNGCDGKGKHTAWPTKWPERAGDLQPVSVALANVPPYTVVVPEGPVLHQETYNPKARSFDKDENWAETFAKALAPYMECIAAIVDYHS